ncbi:MAG: hypothetical protein WKF70_02490 [Chitinophagaceae bacterium]
MLKSISFRNLFLCNVAFRFLALCCSGLLFACADQSGKPSTVADSIASNTSQSSDTPQESGDGNLNHNPFLYALYLNNTVDSPELDRLLKKGSPKRVTFQIYDSSGFLSLAAYRHKNKEPHNVELGYMIHLGRAFLSKETLDNRIVHLGNLQLGSRAFHALRTTVNAPGVNYIVFVPAVKFDAAKGYQHLVYKIYGRPDLSPIVELTDVPICFTNPSPPRNTDEEY